VDGAPFGTLTAFGVGADGVIVGAFDNGLTRPLGQVVLATFANQEGLVDEGSNNFRVGANSGPAILATPTQFGTGQIVGGALELSNVDLGQEFINMIQSSTGYSASSRVIRTTDELLQQLLVLGR
jgi:flagellar hook protein FlgE